MVLKTASSNLPQLRAPLKRNFLGPQTLMQTLFSIPLCASLAAGGDLALMRIAV